MFERLISRQLGIDPPSHKVSVDAQVIIPMADGVSLGASVFRPRGVKAGSSVLIRSPWGRSLKHAPFSILYKYVARRFAERGYHVVLADTRGHHQGQPDQVMPHHNEVTDGEATLAWLIRQPWFDGTLGMWGASFLGYAQWAVATAPLPEAVRRLAIVPATTATNWHGMFHPDGIPATDAFLRLKYLSGTLQLGFLPRLIALARQEKVVVPLLDGRPATEGLARLPPVTGFDFDRLMATPDAGAGIWRSADTGRKIEFDRTAIHLVAGWYDIFLRDQIADYLALRAKGANLSMTIGAWHHTSQDLGPETIRAALDLFDTFLRRGERPNPEVRLHVGGANRWVTWPAWPVATETRVAFPQDDGSLPETPPEGGRSWQEVFHNPLKPPRSRGGATLAPDAGAFSSKGNETQDSSLVFLSEPWSKTDVIAGSVGLYASLRSVRRDAQLGLRLWDVRPDGSATTITEGVLRLCDRLEGEVQDVYLEALPICYEVKAGHRLRAEVLTSLHPHWAAPRIEGKVYDLGLNSAATSLSIPVLRMPT